MPEIQVPEIVQKLRKRFSIKGTGSISTLAPELVGVILVEDLRDQESEWNPCTAGGNRTPVAGELSHRGLWHPAGSGKIVILDRIRVRLATTGWYQLRRATVSLGNQQQGLTRDWRRHSAFAVCEETHNTSVGVVGDVYNSAGLAADPGSQDVALGITIIPGSGLSVVAGTANIGLTVQWFWRERDQRADDELIR